MGIEFLFCLFPISPFRKGAGLPQSPALFTGLWKICTRKHFRFFRKHSVCDHPAIRIRAFKTLPPRLTINLNLWHTATPEQKLIEREGFHFQVQAYELFPSTPLLLLFFFSAFYPSLLQPVPARLWLYIRHSILFGYDCSNQMCLRTK